MFSVEQVRFPTFSNRSSISRLNKMYKDRSISGAWTYKFLEFYVLCSEVNNSLKLEVSPTSSERI